VKPRRRNSPLPGIRFVASVSWHPSRGIRFRGIRFRGIRFVASVPWHPLSWHPLSWHPLGVERALSAPDSGVVA